MSDYDETVRSLLELEEPVHEIDRQTIIRAPFAQPGGKNLSIKYLMQYLPYRNKWIDHFCGSGVVTLNRKPSSLEVMNDRYGGIIAFYRCLRDETKLKALIDWLDTTVHSREEFYTCRDTWCIETDDIVRAAKWYYMIRYSVLGKGHAFGRSLKTVPITNIRDQLEHFPKIHARIRYVQIENLDFETCFRDFDSEDTVHYFDPPYIGTDPGVYEHKWNRNDLARLIKCCHDSKGFVALSGYDDSQIQQESFWTRRESWPVKMKSNIEDKNTVRRTECLWIKE